MCPVTEVSMRKILKEIDPSLPLLIPEKFPSVRYCEQNTEADDIDTSNNNKAEKRKNLMSNEEEEKELIERDSSLKKRKTKHEDEDE